jgi:hypothetical protein
MNRKIFYDAMRQTLFGQITQPQVDGMENILNEWEARELDDLRWLAYILATTYHETGHTMQPIEEWGKGRKHSYGQPDAENGQCYYGRGYVQLTHKRNYSTFADRMGVDLVQNPELALDPSNAVKILIDGMVNGLYTGVGLPRYFGKSTNWEEARRIVNGEDHKHDIAEYAKAFYAALQTASSFQPDEQVRESIVTTTDGEEIIMLEHEQPQPAPPQSIAEPMPVSNGSGWLTHTGMAVSGLIGLAGMLGYVPGMTPEYGAGMIQTALGISGTRKAAPSLIKYALQIFFSLRSKNP